jgi:hydrogenase maturation protease
MNANAGTLYVGIGSSHGDDRAGWLVADALADSTARAQTADMAEFKVCKASTPADLLDWLNGARRLIICDAVRGAGAPGTLHRWQWPDARLGQVRSAWSHDFGLAAVLELAASLGRLPPEVVVWGIEGAQALPNDRISQAVETALPELIARVQAEIGIRCEAGASHVG